MSKRTPCNLCGASKSVAAFPDGTWCYACLTQTKEKSLAPVVHLPNRNCLLEKYDSLLPEIGMNWLVKYRITKKHIAKFGIGWSNEYERLVFPVIRDDHLYYAWMRCPLSASAHLKFGNNCPKWVFSGESAEEPYYWRNNEVNLTKTLIITEDVVSAIRCSDFFDVLALGGVTLKGTKALRRILEYPLITIWLDGDKPGQDAAKRLRKKLQALRPIRIIKTKRDPKEYSNREIKEILK